LTNGTDCSGFTQSVYKHFGISIPRTSVTQSTTGKKVSLDELQAGDLVFYAKNGRVNHVAMYIGGGQVVHASSPKTGIKISNLRYRTPYCARRIVN
jgi:cell wall-associated NlpC family hydrolase